MALAAQGMVPRAVVPARLGRLSPRRTNYLPLRRRWAGRYDPVRPLCGGCQAIPRPRDRRLPKALAVAPGELSGNRPARGGRFQTAGLRCAGTALELARDSENDFVIGAGRNPLSLS